MIPFLIILCYIGLFLVLNIGLSYVAPFVYTLF